MRVATAFFAGAGTVIAAISAGLGGGLLLGDIMSPQQPKYPSSEVTRLERSSQQPISATNGTTQPVPYMASTQVAATVADQPAPPAQPQAQQPQQAQPQQASSQQAQPQVQQASAQPVESKPPEPATAAAPAAVEQPATRIAPEDANARARDSDLRRDFRREERDFRREERERRKAERRQQWDERRQLWVDKRKWRQDDDLGDVEANARDATGSRPFFGREPPRFEKRESNSGRESSFGSGRFGLFDD